MMMMPAMSPNFVPQSEFFSSYLRATSSTRRKTGTTHNLTTIPATTIITTATSTAAAARTNNNNKKDKIESKAIITTTSPLFELYQLYEKENRPIIEASLEDNRTKSLTIFASGEDSRRGSHRTREKKSSKQKQDAYQHEKPKPDKVKTKKKKEGTQVAKKKKKEEEGEGEEEKQKQDIEKSKTREQRETGERVRSGSEKNYKNEEEEEEKEKEESASSTVNAHLLFNGQDTSPHCIMQHYSPTSVIPMSKKSPRYVVPHNDVGVLTHVLSHSFIFTSSVSSSSSSSSLSLGSLSSPSSLTSAFLPSSSSSSSCADTPRRGKKKKRRCQVLKRKYGPQIELQTPRRNSSVATEEMSPAIYRKKPPYKKRKEHEKKTRDSFGGYAPQLLPSPLLLLPPPLPLPPPSLAHSSTIQTIPITTTILAMTTTINPKQLNSITRIDTLGTNTTTNTTTNTISTHDHDIQLNTTSSMAKQKKLQPQVPLEFEMETESKHERVEILSHDENVHSHTSISTNTNTTTTPPLDSDVLTSMELRYSIQTLQTDFADSEQDEEARLLQLMQTTKPKRTPHYFTFSNAHVQLSSSRPQNHPLRFFDQVRFQEKKQRELKQQQQQQEKLLLLQQEKEKEKQQQHECSPIPVIPASLSSTHSIQRGEYGAVVTKSLSKVSSISTSSIQRLASFKTLHKANASPTTPPTTTILTFSKKIKTNGFIQSNSNTKKQLQSRYYSLNERAALPLSKPTQDSEDKCGNDTDALVYQSSSWSSLSPMLSSSPVYSPPPPPPPPQVIRPLRVLPNRQQAIHALQHVTKPTCISPTLVYAKKSIKCISKP